MKACEPIYFQFRPKANQHRTTSSMLHDDSFIKELTEKIELKVIDKYPYISADWMRNTLGSRLVARTMVNIFLEEIGRGHIFCDDLFATTFKKYIGSDIPFYCSQEIQCIICYDFCILYLTHFYKLMTNLYHIDATINDDLTRSIIFKGIPIYMLFEQALKQQHDKVICRLSRSGELPYLHTENNLYEVLARMEEREKSRKPAELPYNFDDTSNDRLISDIITDVELFYSLRITVVGERHSV